MAYTVAITNQKGGVGKTTTAVNLAAALSIAERRTLLVDADPQGNTTSGVGIAKLELQLSLYDALVDGHSAQDIVLPVPGLPHLSVLPATQDLVGAELQLVERPFREAALRRVLEPIEPEYDYVVVDCPPSLGLLTLNVLAAVQGLIIPIQCEYYGLEGISQLLNTVRLVQQNINPGLAIGGVLLTMYDSRLNLCRQVAEDATEYFGSKVFGTPIPRNVRLAEAPSFGKPILLYDVQSVGAKSYLAVGQELLRRVEGDGAPVMPTHPPVAAHAPEPVEPAAPAATVATVATVATDEAGEVSQLAGVEELSVGVSEPAEASATVDAPQPAEPDLPVESAEAAARGDPALPGEPAAPSELAAAAEPPVAPEAVTVESAGATESPDPSANQSTQSDGLSRSDEPTESAERVQSVALVQSEITEPPTEPQREVNT